MADRNENAELVETPQQYAGAVQASVLEQAAIAEIKVAAQLALMRPRNQMQARDRILAACRRPRFATAAIYRKPVGNQRIEGLSIRFAEEALRSWGNVKAQKFVIEDTDERRTVKVCVWDLETGTSYSDDVTVRKVVERRSGKGREVVSKRTNSYGDEVFLVRATEDEMQNREAAMVSKTLRNLALRIIPEDIQEEARELCEKARNQDIAADPDAALKRVVDGFATLRVQPVQLEDYLGYPLAQLTPSGIAELRDLYTALHGGDTTWQAIMESREAERERKAHEPSKAKTSRHKARPAEPTEREVPRGETPPAKAEGDDDPPPDQPDESPRPEPTEEPKEQPLPLAAELRDPADMERPDIMREVNQHLAAIYGDNVEGRKKLLQDVCNGAGVAATIQATSKGDVLMIGAKKPQLVEVVTALRDLAGDSAEAVAS